MTRLKTVLVEAAKDAFDDEYPEPDFRNIHISIEYPIDRQHYPGIWVDFEPAAELHIAGVDHHEYKPGVGPNNENVYGRLTRWTFSGYATFTIAALTSFERDRLHDEMVRVIAFGKEESSTSDFRTYIENNDYLAVNFDFDSIGTHGFAASPGTPWNTEDLIYEVTLSMECFGEFTSDAQGLLVPLSAINTYPYPEGGQDPVPGDDWV